MFTLKCNPLNSHEEVFKEMKLSRKLRSEFTLYSLHAHRMLPLNSVNLFRRVLAFG